MKDSSSRSHSNTNDVSLNRTSSDADWSLWPDDWLPGNNDPASRSNDSDINVYDISGSVWMENLFVGTLFLVICVGILYALQRKYAEEYMSQNFHPYRQQRDESATVSEPHFPPVVIQVPLFIDSEPLLPPYSQFDERAPPPAGQPNLPPYSSPAHGGPTTNEACVPQSPTAFSDGGPPTYEEAMRIKQL